MQILAPGPCAGTQAPSLLPQGKGGSGVRPWESSRIQAFPSPMKGKSRLRERKWFAQESTIVPANTEGAERAGQEC